jgi:hypothetical protein
MPMMLVMLVAFALSVGGGLAGLSSVVLVSQSVSTRSQLIRRNHDREQ